MIMILCECDGGTGVKLPYHLHIRQGLVEMPSGEKRWLNGAISEEERVVLHFDLTWTADQLNEFITRVRESDGDSEATET